MAQIKHYLVGGAVRDRLLDLPVKDRDWVVTGATPQEMSAQGFRAVGKDFPVFLHPETHEEYALARTERKIQAGYHGFQFNTHPDITLKQDLERRDLTINALAQDSQGQIFDYFNGQQDLEKRILRHTSPAFQEDPVRVLRVARFAARYADLGFRIAPETQALMKKMVATGEVDALVAERVWQETYSALNEKKPGVFFEVLRSCGALAILFPEVNQLFGVPQHAQYHPEIDSGLHTLMVLNRSAALSASTAVRFSALTHDLGKGITPKEEWPAHRQHEKYGVPLVKALCERYKVPNRLQQLALLVTAQHLRIHLALELTPKKLLEVFEQCDAFRRPERFMELLIACQADAQGRTGMEQKPYPQRTYFMALLQDCQQVETQAIIQQGYEGVAIREQLRLRRLEKIKAFKQSYNPSI